MGKIDFDERRIAEGYLNRPWLHKAVIERFAADCNISRKFKNGLDVGCGAGLSTKALHLICEQVTGTDISQEMINVCKEHYSPADYRFTRARAEETEEPVKKYDIVTAAGMVNWVDKNLFLQNLEQVMELKGYLLIYDFGITDKMPGNEAYTQWYREEYLKRFPKPARNEKIWTQNDLPDSFVMERQIRYEIPFEFTMGKFIEFMMIQSNVNVQIQNGTDSEQRIREWMEATLMPVFGEESKILLFEGYSWYIRRQRTGNQ